MSTSARAGRDFGLGGGHHERQLLAGIVNGLKGPRVLAGAMSLRRHIVATGNVVPGHEIDIVDATVFGELATGPVHDQCAILTPVITDPPM
jgi:hypothetical protein